MHAHQIAVCIALPLALSVILWHYVNQNIAADTICWRDLENEEQLVCRPKCKYGEFSLPWMGRCQPWLSCQDIEQDVEVQRLIGYGAVKTVYLAKWNDYNVAYNSLNQRKYMDDFRHGMYMMQQLQPSTFITQLIGSCHRNNVFVTEYHKHRSAENIDVLLKGKLKSFDSLPYRFKLCVKYVQILEFLHNTTASGTRVMCDSNDLEKTLKQYLITDDLKLVANDLDALPLVNHTAGLKVKCGHRQLFGDFVAPEQLWPYDDQDFDDNKMPGYDEKTDVWKIPNVCEHFLGTQSESENFKFHLFKIHKKCKSSKGEERPTAMQVLKEFSKLWEEFDFGKF